jgi:hypothetical protein
MHEAANCALLSILEELLMFGDRLFYKVRVYKVIEFFDVTHKASCGCMLHARARPCVCRGYV